VPAYLLPLGIEVFERGWLSANNIFTLVIAMFLQWIVVIAHMEA
jgi:hypothetical protein